MLVVYLSGGRTGNQLVTAAMLIASAEEHQVPYHYMRFQPVDKVKNVNGGLHHLHAAGKKDLLWRLSRILEKWPPFLRNLLRLKFSGEILDEAEKYIDEFKESARDGKIHMWGFWLYTDFKALLKHQDEVRRRLCLKDEYTEAARRVVEKARTPDSILIGVHVRQTDYKTWNNGRFYFSSEQYREWMRQCVQASPKPVRFVVCSDGEVDENTFGIGFDHVTFSHESMFTDMSVLSQCDYIIGPPSTFSGFASFMGNTPKFSLTAAASRISSLEQFRVYLLGYTDIFCTRSEEGLLGYNGPNRCTRICDGVLGVPTDLMQDIDSV